MATFEDFESDEEEFMHDVIALPSHYKRGMTLSPVPTTMQLERDEPVEHNYEEIIASSSRATDVGTLTFSSDPFLSDVCRDQQCAAIHEAWHTHGIEIFHLILIIYILYLSENR